MAGVKVKNNCEKKANDYDIFLCKLSHFQFFCQEKKCLCPTVLFDKGRNLIYVHIIQVARKGPKGKAVKIRRGPVAVTGDKVAFCHCLSKMGRRDRLVDPEARRPA